MMTNCKLGSGFCARVWPYNSFSKNALHYFFFYKSSFLLPCFDQTNFVYSNDDQRIIYKNYKFHDPDVVVLGRGYMSNRGNTLFL